MKFHSRYTEIDALLFDGNNFDEIYAFGGEHVTLHGQPGAWEEIKVHTRNGTADLLQGHYLIQGPYDFYPCDPDTFNTRWQEVPREIIVDEKKLHSSADAAVWAEEFVRLVNMRPVLAMDESVVTGWFANAMETAKILGDDKEKGIARED